MKQLHWDPTAIWKAGFDQIKSHVPASTRMVDLDQFVKSLGCELTWDCYEKRLRIVPIKERKNEKKSASCD